VQAREPGGVTPSTWGGVHPSVLWILQVVLAAYFVKSGYLLLGDDLVKK
jgi:hypothetical protein